MEGWKITGNCQLKSNVLIYSSSTQIQQKLRDKTVETKCLCTHLKNLMNSLSFYAIRLITLVQKSNYTSALATSEVFLG